MEIIKVKSHWDEVWAPINEHETKTKHYFFSNYGRIKSIDKVTESERLLTPAKFKEGYQVFTIKFRTCTKTYFIQRLVADAFCDKKSEEHKFIIHKDGNLDNNHYTNLEFVDRDGLTASFKERDMWNPQKRKPNAAAKMNVTKVKLLKQRLKEGKTKKKILAKHFNITIEQLRKIEKGIDWAWVTIDE